MKRFHYFFYGALIVFAGCFSTARYGVGIVWAGEDKKVDVKVVDKKGDDAAGEKKINVKPKEPVKAPVKTPEGILATLRQQPTLTLAEVAEALGKSSSAVERAARKLREQGRLRYVGPQKGGRWKVLP